MEQSDQRERKAKIFEAMTSVKAVPRVLRKFCVYGHRTGSSNKKTSDTIFGKVDKFAKNVLGLEIDSELLFSGDKAMTLGDFKKFTESKDYNPRILRIFCQMYHLMDYTHTPIFRSLC